MNKRPLGNNGCSSDRCFPVQERENTVRYRVPFSFLETDEERRQDAWNAVKLLLTLQSSPPEDAGLHTLDMNARDLPDSAVIADLDGARVEIEFSSSDIWVKVQSMKFCPEDRLEGLLSQIDSFFLALNRRVYKYVIDHGRFKAFPSQKGKWAEFACGFLGLDAGSISINTAVVDDCGIVLEKDYTLTEGDVLNNIKKSLARMRDLLPSNMLIQGTGVTGSGHEIAMAVLDADIYETELDAHAEAAMHLVPGAQVIFDIGGQDSKVMYIEDGMLDEAGMNKKCGAGTGAFLDAQAARLGIPIEDFGTVSLRANKPYSFSSMCTVFVGRDLISEQAKGNTRENIIAGLHKSLAKNFFSTLGIDKKSLKTPIVFQGGVATNIGVKKALEECLEEARGQVCEIIVPMHNDVMGAIGMALIARREIKTFGRTRFRGFDEASRIVSVFSECQKHSCVRCNRDRICDLVTLYVDKVPDRTLYACREYYQIAV